MPKFVYMNMNLFGAFGISDYNFVCIIAAESKEEALEWGHEVAKKYDEKFGLLPCGDPLSMDSIRCNAFVEDLEVGREEKFQHFCKVGSFPKNFE